MIARWFRRRGVAMTAPMPIAGDAAADDSWFDPAFLAGLERFSLRIADAQKGGRLADQRTPARGQGADFADFRSYTAGDDLRTIDWNLYRRLGKLFVRVFEERQDLPVYLLIDVSRSMVVETPPRLHAARQVALGLAAVALRQHDAVTLLPFSDGAAVAQRAVSGKSNIARLAQALASLRPGGRTGLTAAIRQIGAMRIRRGLLVIVSDFFDDDGIEATVAALRGLRHRLLLVQMTKAHDADPTLAPALVGDVTLDDGEADAGVPLTITPALTEAYRREWRAFNRQLTDFADGGSVGLLRIDGDRDVLEQMTAFFARGQLPW